MKTAFVTGTQIQRDQVRPHGRNLPDQGEAALARPRAQQRQLRQVPRRPGRDLRPQQADANFLAS